MHSFSNIKCTVERQREIQLTKEFLIWLLPIDITHLILFILVSVKKSFLCCLVLVLFQKKLSLLIA